MFIEIGGLRWTALGIQFTAAHANEASYADILRVGVEMRLTFN